MSEATNFYARSPGDAETAAKFADLHPAFEPMAAVVEAHRCLYCFNAPCMGACPTHIDVPKFIKKIASGNMEGSAKAILEANILGASCARACPVEVLCEGACVMHGYNERPIEIGRLQRFAMDALYASGAGLPFAPGAETGKKVALIGGGPASLACAAELRRRGVRAVIFDARPLPGGLNTYGIAEYKLPLKESLREIDMLSQLGVEFMFETKVDAAMLGDIEREYDAVFLGMGLGAIRKLGIAGEEREDVTNALDFIAGYKSGLIQRVSGKVAVVGAGNTAIDAAIAAVRLGADEVTMVYRRGPEQMSAFGFEYEHAKQEGVKFLWHTPAEKAFESGCGLVIMAVGQVTHTEILTDVGVELEDGRVVIDRATGQTTNATFFAGGDCTNGGREVVDAVADGKRAGIGIAVWLGVKDANA
jgi:glutamate synthase (NADPH/NADH) small chain